MLADLQLDKLILMRNSVAGAGCDEFGTPY
jgi:hypothetical protein